MYNMTNVTAANNFYGMVVGVHQLSGNYLGPLFLAALFFIIFIVFKKYESDTKAVFLFDTLMISILGVLFWTIELISWQFLMFPIIALFGSIIIFLFTD